MTDIFEDVEEQLRSERYQAIFRRILPWALLVLALALVVALAVWGWQAWRDRVVSQASERYAAGLAAYEAERDDEAKAAFEEVAESSAGGYKALALMQLGGIAIEAGDVPAAVSHFDAAAEAAPGPLIEDAARLKSALALLDTRPYAELEQRLTPLTEEGRPFRAQAREALAFAKLMAGDLEGARSDFTVLSLLADAPEGAVQRAQAALQAIDSGAAKVIPGAAKAAAALPPTQDPNASDAPQQ